MKKLLVLVLAILVNISSVSAASLADGDSSLSFNDKSFTGGVSVGSLIDDSYYAISIIDSDFLSSGTLKFISATIYVPKDLFINGQHDLVVLKPSKESNTSTACSDDPDKKFTLPSNDKVFIVLSDTSLQLTTAFAVVKGAVATDENETGSVTFRNISTVSNVTTVEGDFDISTLVSKYSAKIPLSLDLDCKTAQKKIKVTVARNASSSDASGSFSSIITVIPSDSGDDSDDEDLNFRKLGLPTHHFIKH